MPCRPNTSSRNQQSCSLPNCNNCPYKKHYGTLNDRIQCYKNNYDTLVEEENQFYQSASSVEEAILRAAQSQNIDGKMNNHQKRLGESLCTDIACQLVKQSDKIIEAQKNGFKTLHNYILEYTQTIRRVGQLYVYDVSARLAKYFNLPIHDVYIHAGTRKGARYLELAEQNGIIPHKELPNVIKENLSADEVENFLCICKDSFPTLQKEKVWN